MVRRSAPVRYVRPDTARIGDTVRVRWKVADVTMERVGTIRKRSTVGNRTEALTEKGVTLFAWAGATTEPEAITITLLTREQEDQEPLF